MKKKYMHPTNKDYWVKRGYSEEESIFRSKSYIKTYPEYWIKRGFSKDEAIEKAKTSCYAQKSSKRYWMSIGYSEKDATNEARKYKKDYPDYWIRKGMNEEDAIKESRKYRKNNIEYWLSRGFDKDVAQYEVDKRNPKKIEFYTSKGYTIEEAIEKSTHVSKTSSKGCLFYWIDKGYSEEEAKELSRENVKLTHNRYVEYWTSRGYSEEEAIIKVNEQKPSCVEYWQCRGYGLDEAKEIIKHIKCPHNKSNIKLSSKIETKFMDELEEFIGYHIERSSWTTIEHNNFCIDGRISNIVIEFNGEKFHLDDRFCNNESKTPYNKTFEETKEYDNHKIGLYIKHGYNVIIVWEYDYKRNKEFLFDVLKDKIKEFSTGNGKLWDSSKHFFLV